MKLNPFDEQLENAETRASELSVNLKSIIKDINWYESTELKVLVDSRDKLQNQLDIQSHDCIRLRDEITQIEASINKLSESVSSLFNPKNWFDSRQRELRGSVSAKKTSLKTLRNNASTAQDELHNIEHQMRTKNEEIKKYNSFDLDAKRNERIILENELSHQKEKIERISSRRQQVDAALAPIVKQIRDAEQKKSENESVIIQARRFDNELSNADNSYERAMVHQKCEDKFGTGNPKKVISQKESEIRRIDRDLEKLLKRAKNVADNASRNIKKLIIDGNNLCYQGDIFIGLSAIKSLVPILAKDYEVVLVFDASIRRAIGNGDSDIRDILGGDINVHIVATSVKADETVLDIAGPDKTAFIVSNDRFAEFGEKPAIRDQRVIRHEIVSGRVLIHDLGVSEMFTQ